MDTHTLRDVLARKSSVVAVIDADDTLEEAVARMHRFDVGAMIVVASGGFIGLLSDRDVLKCVADGKRLGDVRVVDALPREVVVARPDTTVRAAIELMERRRRRHLPVVAAAAPVGIVSLGDLLHFVANDLQIFVTDLVSYIHGPGVTVEPYSGHHRP